MRHVRPLLLLAALALALSSPLALAAGAGIPASPADKAPAVAAPGDSVCPTCGAVRPSSRSTPPTLDRGARLERRGVAFCRKAGQLENRAQRLERRALMQARQGDWRDARRLHARARQFDRAAGRLDRLGMRLCDPTLNPDCPLSR